MNLQIIFIIFGLLEKQKTLAQKIDETVFLFAVLSFIINKKEPIFKPTTKIMEL